MAKTFDPSRQQLGTLCKRGHEHSNTGLSLRWIKASGKSGDCVVCRKQDRTDRYSKDGEAIRMAAKRRYHENRERVQEVQRQYREKHEDELQAYRARWRAENAETIREKKRIYYQANADRLKKKQTLYYKRVRQKELVKRAAWRRQYPEKLREQYRLWIATPRGQEVRRAVGVRYRGRKAQQKGVVTVECKQAWLEVFRFCCPVCGDRMDCTPGSHHAKSLTWDHVIPISRGGRDDDSNLLPLCQSCNSKKSNRTYEEWLGRPINSYADLSERSGCGC